VAAPALAFLSWARLCDWWYLASTFDLQRGVSRPWAQVTSPRLGFARAARRHGRTQRPCQ
jgi:hypothetical protein